MYESYKVIAITPAGRRRYMEVLKTYIMLAKDIIDEWHLWVNTCDVDDIKWMEEQATDPFIKLIEPEGRVDRGCPSYSIHQFFKRAQDPKTIYIRFDDDIVYVHPDAVKELCCARIADKEPFLVYANCVNNSVCTHLHQRMGAIGLKPGKSSYMCLDPVAWQDGGFAIDVHTQFLKHVHDQDLSRYMFSRWLLWEPDRVSINCFAFFGEDFASFDGVVPVDEETWLSTIKPRELGRPTMIAGGALVSHYAYYTQRPAVEGTNILEVYRLIAAARESMV